MKVAASGATGVEVSSPEDPDFILGLERLQCSTLKERIDHLKFHFKFPIFLSYRSEICYLLLKEQCSLDDRDGLRSTVKVMLELPHSQTKEAYKELWDFFLRNYSLCQENGLCRREGEELLKEIEDAETHWQACSPEFSLSRYLRETTHLKNKIKEWVECPLLFFVKKGVDALSNRVNKLSVSIIIRPVNPEGIVSHENIISSNQPVNRDDELSTFYNGITNIWTRDYSSSDLELDVECVVEAPFASLEERHKFSIL